MSTEAITRSESSGNGKLGSDQGALGDATSTAKEAAATVKEEAATVASTVREQVRSMTSDVTSELRTQADERSRQAASRLDDLSSQIEALVSGRPQDAGPLPEYLREGQAKVRALALRLEQRGPQGIIDDAVAFGRRHPGVFMFAAAGLGFAVGRLARAGAFEQSSNVMQGASSMTTGSSRVLSPSGGTQ